MTEVSGAARGAALRRARSLVAVAGAGHVASRVAAWVTGVQGARRDALPRAAPGEGAATPDGDAPRDGAPGRAEARQETAPEPRDHARAPQPSSSSPPEPEQDYEHAHRILSELSVVARQLSLGLDARTLASALLDELGEVVPHTGSAVLTRSPGGRFVALVGDLPPDVDEDPNVEEAWLSAAPTRGARREGRLLVVPILMGARVVALLVLTGGPALTSTASVAACRAAVGRAGPRLASALLFEDVRRVATVDERLRMAREIHDGVAQELASVGYVLDDLAARAEPEIAEEVRALRSHLQGVVTELRLSIFDLRSGVDETLGLGTALGEHLQRVCAQSGLTLHLVLDETTERLPIGTEVELLRIVQEAVTNVRKHARAQNLWVECRISPPTAEVVVRDDGRGLQAARPDSVGLTGMRERARRIGAVLEVGEHAGGGVEIRVLVGAEQPAPGRRRGGGTR